MPFKTTIVVLFFFILLSCKKKENPPVQPPVSQSQPTNTSISNFLIPGKHIGDANFLIPAPVSNNEAAFIYSSDNPAIASIKGDSIQIKGIGSVNITATQKATTQFTAASIKTTFVVSSNIYISGNNYTIYGNQPIYWKNGNLVMLEGEGIATDIFVQKKDVYIAGSMVQSGSYYHPGYWKNGVQYIISKSYGETSAITVLGNDVYVLGNIVSIDQSAPNKPTVWKNGKVMALKNPLICCGIAGATVPAGITVHNNKVYICGYAQGNIESYFSTAMVWGSDGTAITLSKPPTPGFRDTVSAATSIIFQDNDMYACGTSIYGSNKYLTYWKNGVPTSIPDNTQSYFAYDAIAVTGADVYVTGVDQSSGTNIATYWKNGVKTALAPSAEAHRIITIGNDIYICGEIYDNTNYEIATPVYWLNGISIKLPAPPKSTNTITTGIAFANY